LKQLQILAVPQLELGGQVKPLQLMGLDPPQPTGTVITHGYVESGTYEVHVAVVAPPSEPATPAAPPLPELPAVPPVPAVAPFPAAPPEPAAPAVTLEPALPPKPLAPADPDPPRTVIASNGPGEHALYCNAGKTVAMTTRAREMYGLRSFGVIATPPTLPLRKRWADRYGQCRFRESE
jgi:hypothetical protein